MNIENNAQQSDQLFVAEQLWEVLNLERVSRHVRKMFKVGTDLKQESAFAVYEKPARLQVSDLLVPDVTDISADSPVNLEQATGVNIAPLIRRQGDVSLMSLDEILGNQDDKLIAAAIRGTENRSAHEISTSAQRAVDAILVDSSLDASEKRNLSEAVRDKDYRQAKGERTTIKDDVLLLAHNHPQLWDDRVKELLIPSPEDLRSYEFVRQSNKGVVEMIVAASKQGDRGAIMYAAGADTLTTAQQYYEDYESAKSISGRLDQLTQSGYQWVALDLQKDGTPCSEDEDKVEGFVARLNAA